jgi:predicted Zn-dependent peptidase
MVFDSILDKKELHMEKKVVEAEIKKTRDDPSRYIHELNDTTTYNNHPLGRSIAAEIDDVHRIKQPDLMNFYKKYYSTRNMVLSISGNYPYTIREMLQNSIFSRSSHQRVPIYKSPILKQVDQSTIDCHFKELKEIHVMISFMAYTIYDDRKYILDVLNIIMASTMSSRLFRRLREKNGLVYGISMGSSLHENYGNIYITAGIHKEKLYKNGKKMGAIKMIIDELLKLKYNKVSSKELQLAKNVLTGHVSLRTEDSMDLAEYYGEQVLFKHQNIISYKNLQQKYRNVSKQNILDIANECIHFNKMYINVLGNIDENKFKKYIKNNIFKKFIPKKIKKYDTHL